MSTICLTFPDETTLQRYAMLQPGLLNADRIQKKFWNFTFGDARLLLRVVKDMEDAYALAGEEFNYIEFHLTCPEEAIHYLLGLQRWVKTNQ